MAASDLTDIKNKTGDSIVILSWKVSEGTHVSNSSILFSYHALKDEKKTVKKFRASSIGTVHEILLGEGSEVSQKQTILRLTGCKHPTVMKDLCAECGADLRCNEMHTSTRINQASVSMIHSVPELKVSQELAMKIGKADEERLMKAKKLVLLVDLDQTLIHTTNDNIPNNIKDVHHYQLHGPNSPWYHTRLRPGTMKFLENVSKMYQLHICTFGVRVYAHKIASILDSDGKYFAQRILSRDECFNPISKTANLNALFPCGDSMVCIIDDREDVWNFSPNLIPVKPYHFFQHTGDINAPPGLDKTEQDSDDEEENLLSRVIKSALNKKTTNDITDINSVSNFARFAQLQARNDVDEVDNRTDNPKKAAEPETSSSSNVSPPFPVKIEIEPHEKKPNSDEKVIDDSASENISKVSEECTMKSDSESESAIGNDPTNAQDVKVSTNGNIHSKIAVNGEKELEKSSDGGIVCEKPSDSPDELTVNEPCLESVAETKSSDFTDKVVKVSDATNCENSVFRDDKQTNSANAEDAVDGMVDVEDNDDYLLYLEEILKMIHKAYYKIYNQTKNLQKPDLNYVVPYVRRKVFRRVNIVFSGVIPTNMPIAKNKAYRVAKSLGAVVQPKVITHKMADDPSKVTTHLIAAHPGTAKVIEARKSKGLYIVNVNWLWSCSERWEHVDERLFPLVKSSSNRSSPISSQGSPYLDSSKKVDDSQNKASKPELPRYDPATGKKIRKQDPLPSQEPINFAKSYNPLLAFSLDDIADMDKEVEDIFNEESDGSNDENEMLMEQNDEDSSSEESLSNDRPRGWKRKHSDRWKDLVMSSKDDEEEQTKSSSDSEDENHSKYSRFDKLNSSNDQSDCDESVGSVDEEMAAAIERELLNS